MQTSLHLVLARIIATSAKRRASDIHFTLGNRPIVRIDDTLTELSQEDMVTEDFIKNFLELTATDEERKELMEKKNTTFVSVFEDKVRMRVNAFFQKGNTAISIKLIPMKIPPLETLGVAKSLESLISLEYGLVIIAGPYNSGRTTTIAALIEEINKKRSKHIVMIQKPIEYVFTNKKSTIEQREVGKDALSFSEALRYSQEEDADIIVMDNTEEKEAVFLLLEFASGGRLVFFVMNALTAIEAIEKIIGSFPSPEQSRVCTLLARTLKCLFTQRLVARIGGGKIVAQEILFGNSAVQTVIEQGKVQQISTIMQTSRTEGMVTLDQSLADLVKTGEVSFEDALAQAIDKQNFKTMIHRG